MFINGVILMYLTFTKKLSSNKKEFNLRSAYISLGVLFISLIVISILSLLDYWQVLDFIMWVAAIISTIALLIRIIQLIKEHRSKQNDLSEKKGG
jgi:hypothetical protein